jgi:YgiT-type zinc finger domain-containing protein
MLDNLWNEPLVERKVIYTLEVNGKLIVIEHVPARVNLETGEQLFSPETVERLQKMIWEQRQPSRVMQVPVFEFA